VAGRGMIHSPPSAPPIATPAIPTTRASAFAVSCRRLSNTVVESDRYEGWYRYTNLDYGFSFHYPPDWTLEDKLHLLVLTHKFADTLRFTVVYHGIDEDVWLFRTGMPAGDFVPRGSVPFLGRELSRNALVYEGKTKMMSYGYGDATPWTDVVLNIVLEELVTSYEAIDLREDVQKQVDQVVSSFELTGD
jgi:hypothetical protein